jgi:D-glycero-alpha-D-manno-heptose-7-phosphate kinase
MEVSPTINVRSPLRVDLVGMTDYLPYCEEHGGSIVNATINKYIYALARAREDGRFVFHAPDLETTVEVPSHDDLDPHGELGLAQEIARRLAPQAGVELTTYSQMPGGAGLGSSSTIATCIIAALNSLGDRRLTDHEMARMAIDCEKVALRTSYGWQDQYSPVTGGGVKYMHYWPGGAQRAVEVNQIPLTDAQIAALQRSLVVCYSGISRPAGNILHAVADGYREGRQQVLEALSGMSELGEQMRLALLDGRLDDLGPLLSDVWGLHKRLHEDVTNDRIERLYQLAMDHGAIGGRVCGAGGGGTLLFYCPAPTDYAVAQALADADAEVFDVAIDRTGLMVW